MPFNVAPVNIPPSHNQNISSVGGGVADQKVVESLYGYNPFAIERIAYQRHGKAPTFLEVMDLMGPDFNTGKNAPTTGHYEREWQESLVKIGSIVTGSDPGNGASVIVALHADMMFNPSVTVAGVAAQASYPREKQMVYLKNGLKAYIELKNTSVTPHRLTLKPIVATENIWSGLTAGESYFIPDNAWAHGSGLPTGVMPRVVQWTNTFQIVKDAFGATGSELTNETFVQFKQMENGSIVGVIEQDTMDRFDRARSNAMLWGQQINNITDTDTQVGYDVPVQGTEGYIKWLELGALADGYTAGSFVIDDFYAVGTLQKGQRTGASQVLATLGYQLYIDVEQSLQNTFANDLVPAMVAKMQAANGVTFDDWQPVNDKDFVAYLGFKAAHVGGFSYFFKEMHEFTELVGAGATGYTQPQWGIYAPLNTYTDRVTKNTRAKVGYEWKQLGSYSRKVVIAELAGAGVAGTNGYRQVAVNEFDVYKCGLVSEQAFHGALPNHFVFQKPV